MYDFQIFMKLIFSKKKKKKNKKKKKKKDVYGVS